MSNPSPKTMKFDTALTVDLLAAAAAQTRRGQASGALQPIATRAQILHRHGVDFTIHTLAPGDPKAEALAAQHRTQARGTPADPFLPPYDPDLFVADLSPTHVCVLNKFPVLSNHLLIVTRHDEPQTDLLTLADFQALWACLAQVDGLAFFNGGRTAGASQPHKHLQLVPFLGNQGVMPLEARILGSAGLPFPHELVRLDPRTVRRPRTAAVESFAHYHRLLVRAGLGRRLGQAGQAGPYNLLLTRRWMLLVPRRLEESVGIGANGQGFAGSLLVRTAAQMDHLRRRTPLLFLQDIVGRTLA